MAKAKKEYFGEENETVKTKKVKKAASPKKEKKATKRKYTRRKNVEQGFVNIRVPASLAFEFGMRLGQTMSQ